MAEKLTEENHVVLQDAVRKSELRKQNGIFAIRTEEGCRS